MTLSQEESKRIEELKKKLYSKTAQQSAVRSSALHSHKVDVGNNWEESEAKLAEKEALKKKIEDEERAGADVKAVYGTAGYGVGAYGHYSQAEEVLKQQKKVPISTGAATTNKGRGQTIGEFMSEKFSTDRAASIQKKLAAKDVTLQYAAAQVQSSIYPEFQKKPVAENPAVVTQETQKQNLEEERYHPDIHVFTVGNKKLEDMSLDEIHGTNTKQPREMTKLEKVLDTAQKEEKIKRFSFGSFLFLAIFLFFVGALGYAYIHFERGTNVISPDKIDITVIGPVTVVSGEVSDFLIDIKNNNSADLIQSDLVVLFPDGTKDPVDTGKTLNNQRIDVDTIHPGQTVRQKVSAVFFGEENVKKNIQYSFEFNIEDSANIFKKDKTVGVTIAGSPVTAKITNVREITNNKELTFDVEVVSNSPEVVKNVQLRVDFPFGYKLLESSVKPSAGNNVWNIGDIEALGARTVQLKGALVGTVNLEKNFRFTLGIADQKTGSMSTVLTTQDQKVFIKEPFVVTTLTIGGTLIGPVSVQYADTMRGTIAFTNNLKTPITDVVVEMRIAGVLVNRKTVSPEDGFYRSGDDVVFWDKAQNEELASVDPGETRSLNFNTDIIESRDDLVKILRRSSSSFVITVKGKRLNENRVPEEITYDTSRELRLQTKLSMESYLTHVSGPTPAQVNKESVVRFNGKIRNTANMVKGTVFTAKLPPNAVWKNSYSSNLPVKGVTYNTGKREVSLQLGEIPAGTGLDTDPIDFYFDVGFTPSLTQAGLSPDVILSPTLGGTDSFTGGVVQTSVGAITTAGALGGDVVE